MSGAIQKQLQELGAVNVKPIRQLGKTSLTLCRTTIIQGTCLSNVILWKEAISRATGRMTNCTSNCLYFNAALGQILQQGKYIWQITVLKFILPKCGRINRGKKLRRLHWQTKQKNRVKNTRWRSHRVFFTRFFCWVWREATKVFCQGWSCHTRWV